jgi:hypothetical protein
MGHKMKPDIINFERAVTELYRNQGATANWHDWYFAYREALSHVASENYLLELEDSSFERDDQWEAYLESKRKSNAEELNQ